MRIVYKLFHPFCYWLKFRFFKSFSYPFVIFGLLFTHCYASVPLLLSLNGILDQEKMQIAKDLLDKYEGDEVVLHLDSWTGDLKASLDFAQYLYGLKASKGFRIVSYVENRAVGPAAIFPFLADRWITTPVFAWGDITYNSREEIPQNQLQSLLFNLIPENAPKRSLQKLIAQAMIDPSVALVNENGWKLNALSTPKEPLVLNHEQLVEMGFTVESLTPHVFHQTYGQGDALSFLMQKASADKALAEHIHYHLDKANPIGYLYIGNGRSIDQSTYLQVKFALEEYRRQNVIFVLLHLDTPGGEVFPAMKIAELLQEMDAKYHIPVVAVIHNWALSAGAMLAYACRFIAVTDASLMGAAEPVFAGTGGKMESAPEKIVSALRAEFSSLAKFWGRNPLIAEAMVDKDILVVKRHGQIIQLNSEQELRLGGEDPDRVISPKGKLLTLDTDQLLSFGVANFDVPISSTAEVTQLEKTVGEWPTDQSQLFNYPFFAKIPYATILYYQDWKVDFFAFLTHPIVSSLLMMGLIIGIYMEMSHPGFGFPALLSIGCLALILLSNFATEAINWLEILLVILGILLLLAEVFILPGFGIVGVMGILLVIFGLIAMLLPSFNTVHFSWNWQEWNLPAIEFVDQLAYNLAVIVAALIIVTLLARYVSPRLLKRSRIVLEGDQQGNVAGPEVNTLPIAGSEGEAFTSLRPGGKVLIQNHLYDALTEGGFIEQGEKVVVSKIQGSAIIVAKKIQK